MILNHSAILSAAGKFCFKHVQLVMFVPTTSAVQCRKPQVRECRLIGNWSDANCMNSFRRVSKWLCAFYRAEVVFSCEPTMSPKSLLYRWSLLLCWHRSYAQVLSSSKCGESGTGDKRVIVCNPRWDGWISESSNSQVNGQLNLDFSCPDGSVPFLYPEIQCNQEVLCPAGYYCSNLKCCADKSPETPLPSPEAFVPRITSPFCKRNASQITASLGRLNDELFAFLVVCPIGNPLDFTICSSSRPCPQGYECHNEQCCQAAYAPSKFFICWFWQWSSISFLWGSCPGGLSALPVSPRIKQQSSSSSWFQNFQEPERCANDLGCPLGYACMSTVCCLYNNNRLSFGNNMLSARIAFPIKLDDVLCSGRWVSTWTHSWSRFNIYFTTVPTKAYHCWVRKRYTSYHSIIDLIYR